MTKYDYKLKNGMFFRVELEEVDDGITEVIIMDAVRRHHTMTNTKKFNVYEMVADRFLQIMELGVLRTGSKSS